jgi:hypothetical protein
MKSVLELSPAEAKQFFLNEKSYCEFDLPPYFTFGNLLTKLSDKIGNTNLKDYCLSKPRDYSNVNYVLLNNKDGKYAWRPYQLIHPAIYVSLAHKITEEIYWKVILERFKQFRLNEKIKCYSLPVQSESDESDRAEQVKHWWENVEQQSIELSLEYEYLLETDIADCYGSIYSHSIAWALHGKDFAKEKTNRIDESLIGNIIDWHIQDMTYGQTNGLPQGSALMDFIAEIVLGYADLLLTAELDKNHITEYKIIRYRDDYRIFVNNPHTADIIAKNLTEVLFGLGLKINANKSKFSSEVVKSSLKPGKYFWVSNQTKNGDHQKQLYIIHSLSQNYPNSGIVQKLLDGYYHQIKNGVRSYDNVIVLIAILTDIALNSPRTYPVIAAVLSKLIFNLPPVLPKATAVNKILKRFEKIPNTGYLQIWLQRITLKLEKTFPYEESLCKKVTDDKVEIWNSEWLNNGLKKIIEAISIVDQKVVETLPETIDSQEVELFKTINEYY